MSSSVFSSQGGSKVWSRSKQSIIDHYQRVLRHHGPSAQGMEWKDEASQRLRFAILCDVHDLNGRSVHEIGSGAGHLVDFLAENALEADYSGSDICSPMIESARRLHPGVRFEQMDILKDPCQERFDVVLCSGVFNVRLNEKESDWRSYVQSVIYEMFAMCRVAIAFNVMSDHVDYREDHLYYAKAGDMLDFCRRQLSRHVILRHDYPLYEYTVYVYRNPNELRR